MKDLSTQNVITMCNSLGPLYTMCLPSQPAPSSHVVAPLAIVASASTWQRRLGHPGVNVLSKLSHDSSVICSRHTHNLCHACQLGCHTRMPFASSNSCAYNNFDIIHCDMWTSLIVSIFDYKYYLVILDDRYHFVCTFPLWVKSDTSSTLSKKSLVSTRFGRTIKCIQCDNGRAFDNANSRAFFVTSGVILRISYPYTSLQNGKVEHILRTLLFQASISAHYCVVPCSEKMETKPPYVCPGCSNHTYSNNMINMCHVQ
jgi:hypothetical protein